MICQRCGEKDATVHLTKIINGQKTELYLCEDCARETGQISFQTDPFSFQNLLAGILNPGLNSYTAEQGEQKCDICGMTYQEFTQKGLFGCSQCYDSFSNKLNPLIKRIQGSVEHVGKVPRRRGGALRIRREIDRLRDKMQAAVQNEEFEKAAELRDRIKELEKNRGGE